MQAAILSRPRNLYLAAMLICALGLSPLLYSLVIDRGIVQDYAEDDVRAHPVMSMFLQESTRYVAGSHHLDLGLVDFHYTTSIPDLETLVGKVEASLSRSGMAFARLSTEDGPRWRVDGHGEIMVTFLHGEVTVNAER